MTKNKKASYPAKITGSIKQSQGNLTKNNRQIQQLTRPGTALTAFLKRYKFDLLQLECTREVSRLVDCCDCILNEVEAQHD